MKSKTKLIIMLITFFTTAATLFVHYSAYASDFDSIKYTVTNGAVCITGVDDGVCELVIPSEIDGCPVNTIDKNAFAGNLYLTKVTIPDSVTSIGEYAFSQCEYIKEISLGKNIQSIGAYAFFECKEITSLDLPKTLSFIGDCAFHMCVRLTEISIPEGISSISDKLFKNCYRLKSVVLPDSVRSIGKEAFYGCGEINELRLPYSLKSIGENAFKSCYLSAVHIPNNAFWCGLSLENPESSPITHSKDKYSDTLTDGTRLYISGKEVTSFVIPSNFEVINPYLFYRYSYLTEVVIPKQIKSIGEKAFDMCSELETIYYTGTESEWNLIEIREINRSLENAKFVYDYKIPQAEISVSARKMNGYHSFYVVCSFIASDKPLIIVCYDGAKLSHTETYFYREKPFSFMVTDDVKFDKVKIIALDSFKSMTPLGSAVTIEL